MQLNLATRQSAAYFAFNLCMPCLFIKCKRAVDRISPEDLLWLYLVDSQRISIYSKMNDGGFFTIHNNHLWNLRIELWTILCVSSSRGERDGYFGFNPADDALLEVFPLPFWDAVRARAAVAHLCLVRPSPRDGSLPLSFLCSSLYYNFELSLCCCSVQRSECPMLC